MTEYEIHNVIKKQLCKEAEQIAEQIQKNNSMSVQDLEKLDKIYHLKKNMLKVSEMEGLDDYQGPGMSNEINQNGNSGYHGRAANGRYVSRMSGNSYADGYDRGYSEAMNHMHTIPYYDEPRRW
jgi:hypothetical protein